MTPLKLATFSYIMLAVTLLIGCKGVDNDKQKSSSSNSSSSASSPNEPTSSSSVSTETVSLCDKIDGRSYFSVELLDGRITPEGVTKTHWTVGFSDGLIVTAQYDYSLIGKYTCANGELVATIKEQETKLAFSEDFASLSFSPENSGDVVYAFAQKNPGNNGNRCSEITGQRFVSPNTSLDTSPEVGPTYLEFHRFPNKVVIGQGDVQQSGYYDCQYGGRDIVHVHVQGSYVPMLVEIGPNAQYLTILDEHQTYLQQDAGGGIPCTLDDLPVCTLVPTDKLCTRNNCPTHYFKTFSNRCMAGTGAWIVVQDACGEREGQEFPSQIDCINISEPLCGKTYANIQCLQAPCENYVYKTFGNSCEARTVFANTSFEGECSLLEMEDQVAYEHQPTRLYHLNSGTSEPAEMPSSDGIQVIESSIRDDILTVKLGYSGCDVQPIYYNVDASSVLESLPEQVRFSFSKTTEDDCDTALTETYQYDLLPIRANFRSIVDGEHGLLILGVGGPLYRR